MTRRRATYVMTDRQRRIRLLLVVGLGVFAVTEATVITITDRKANAT